MWDPNKYLAFADHRGRPFHDLVNRVGAEKPRRVVDLGCGPGNLTETLSARWPDATIEAFDSSPEMVEAARARVRTRLERSPGPAERRTPLSWLMIRLSWSAYPGSTPIDRASPAVGLSVESTRSQLLVKRVVNVGAEHTAVMAPAEVGST